jgi:hypothetical protein
VFEAVRDGNSIAARRAMMALLDMTHDSLEQARYGEGMRLEDRLHSD